MNEMKIRKGLYSIFLTRLANIKKETRKEIMPFPLIFERLCSNFSIPKKDLWEVLLLLNDVGIIKIIL